MFVLIDKKKLFQQVFLRSIALITCLIYIYIYEKASFYQVFFYVGEWGAFLEWYVLTGM